MHYLKRGKTWIFRFETAKICGSALECKKAALEPKEAEVACHKAYLEYFESGACLKPTEMSVHDYLDFWLESYAKINCKATTYESYKELIKYYVKSTIGQFKLRNL